MSQIINFKKSPYFVFKQNLYASNSGIALHSKESFDLNGESTWSDPSGFKEDGYVLFMSEGLGETKCDLFLKYSPEGKLIEFRLLYGHDSFSRSFYSNGNVTVTDPFEKENYLIQYCATDWGLEDNNVGIYSRNIDSVEVKNKELIFEMQHSGGEEIDGKWVSPNEYLHINCENGFYDIHELDLVLPKNILSIKDVQVHFPCCDKKTDFDLKIYESRLGKLDCLLCEDCNRSHMGIDNYLWSYDQKIDFNVTQILGHNIDKSDTKMFYGWAGNLRNDVKEKPKFKFMFES